jgi:tyrosinase
MTSVADLQSRVDDVLSAELGEAPAVVELAAGEEPSRPNQFSAFHLPDVQRAKVLAAEWMQRAEEVRAEDGMAEAVAAALEVAGGTVAEMEAAADEDAELGRHAVKLFLTHYRHDLPLRIQGLERRAPWLILPSSNGEAPTESEASPEERLRWLREDPKLNEHHEHWHVVYPISGVPAPDKPRGGVTKDRQGELFLYMHRQMLARYDTERLAVGLEPVEPWDFHDKEPWGYDPGQYLRPRFNPRLPGRGWETTPEGEKGKPASVMVTVQDMAERGKRLFEAASSGHFELPNGARVPVDVNLLGLTQEADIGTVETNVLPWKDDFSEEEFVAWYNALIVGHYGNFHNVGHDMFGWLSEENRGVMEFVPTAMRDHVFFRWHRLIDNLCSTWQDTQPSHDFSADAPPVTIRKGLPGQPQEPNRSPDIILCLQRDLIPWDRWDEFGDYAFGGASWDEEFATGTFAPPAMPSGFKTTAELQTEMRRRVVTIETGREDPAKPEPPHEIEYLDQEEFFYFFRLENESKAEQDVTVRVFLVAADPKMSEDRRMWIEMDKFKQTLAAEEKAVVFRPASLSSAIRRPGAKPPSAEQPPVQAPSDPMQRNPEIAENYCDCGWPYNLLLPRGKSEGMRFRLLVMLTDWKLDNVPQEGDCGSMSYCGAREKYPDTRPMGYPFDAPFGERTIAETIAAAPNMATRDFTIRWV